MPLAFQCPCGQRMTAEPTAARMQVKCPACGRLLLIASPAAPPPALPAVPAPRRPGPRRRWLPIAAVAALLAVGGTLAVGRWPGRRFSSPAAPTPVDERRAEATPSRPPAPDPA